VDGWMDMNNLKLCENVHDTDANGTS